MSTIGGGEAVIAVGLAYAIGLARIWSRVGVGRLVSRTRAVLFIAGLVVVAVALGPPLEARVTHVFTLHMLQHVLLMMVAAPLLVLGAPLPTLLWALPDRARVRTQRCWQRLHRQIAGDRWPLWVGGATVLQTVALGIWHIPSLYDDAVQSPLVHSGEHAAFLFTSIAFWWVITSAVTRSRYGAGVLTVFIAKFPGVALGVALVAARHVWYPAYGTGPAALRDQQGAGVVMWVGGGSLATMAGLVLFWHWMQALERAAPSEPDTFAIEELSQ
ncbi:MAG TPA: cytochrome c oxidase assembly protein [Acidimicrobiia bacterium]|nr:cytochrome c oxidase assembly protein [Acidimicrobiia bacterium]